MARTLRRFGGHDSLDELTALLHRAYAAHAAAGRTFFASYQSPADTQHRIAKGECWILADGQAIAGTVTVVARYHFPDGYPAPEGAGTFYQLAVEPLFQGQGLGDTLVRHAETRIRDLGSRTVAIDTSRQAVDLIAWYLRRGYVEAGSWHWDVTNYESIVMIKSLT